MGVETVSEDSDFIVLLVPLSEPPAAPFAGFNGLLVNRTSSPFAVVLVCGSYFGGEVIESSYDVE